MTAHPTTLLPNPTDGGTLVPIDTGLVPIISAIWAAGLVTHRSCEAWPHQWRSGVAAPPRVWIEFGSWADATTFVMRVVERCGQFIWETNPVAFGKGRVSVYFDAYWMPNAVGAWAVEAALGVGPGRDRG